MKRYEFNKLVRHKLPARMMQASVVINDENLDKAQYLLKLNEKLLEEAHEVCEAKGDDICTELADVLEVVHAIAKANNFSMEEIEKARVKKLEKNGDFNSDNYINYIEVSLDNKDVIDFMENDDKEYKNGN